jgi:GxxExxY protein
MKEQLDDNLIDKITHCAVNVHNSLGHGLTKKIYQKAFDIELKKAGMAFVREINMPVIYEGEKIGSRCVDFLVNGKILIDLKVVPGLEHSHISQALNYLEAYSIENGILINFGATNLELKRLSKVLKRHRDSVNFN